MGTYNFSGDDVPISKVASYLHRIRACASSSYMEYSVLGLCAIIEARQRCESSNNTSKLFFIRPAEKYIQFAGSENSRVQAYITAEILSQNVQRVCSTAGVLQLAMDSKHRVLMNNYPVTAFGVLDAGQQFNFIALALSNKEDKNMHSAIIQGMETLAINL
jgi:hypothetical protein